MPRNGHLRVNGREYVVTYADDAPPRAGAVSFFQRSQFGGSLEHGLFPAMNLPTGIEGMSLRDAQRYLDNNPIRQEWTSLTISGDDPIQDKDLSRLVHIPELDTLQIRSSKITDVGVSHLQSLPLLSTLLLYSASVTDDCLEYISNLSSLRILDMQICPGVSPKAFSQMTMKLLNLENSYAPFDPMR